MRNRYDIPGKARFLTFSCHGRLPLFKNDEIKDHFVDHLRTTTETLEFRLLAWVVMPEHVHLLLVPDLERHSITDILMALKRPFAQTVLRRWKQLEAPILPRLTDDRDGLRFWLKGGGYDRTLRSVDEITEKQRYIEANPVRRGLVANPGDWRWSSCWWRDREGYGGTLVASWRSV